MPDVRMPDGTIISNVPEGTTRSQLMARYGKAVPKKDARPTSFLQGVKEGVEVPFNNAARLLEYGLDKVGVADGINRLGAKLGMAPSVASAEKQQQANNAKSPYKGSGFGKFVGNVAGTLPTMALPGGPFAQGAYSTGLLTDSREPDKIAAEMVVGGLLGKGADKITRAASKAIAPKVSSAVKTLTGKGVRVTPGQAARGSDSILGRMVTSVEDRGSSLPGPTGDAIRKGQKTASEDFVKGAVNSSLADIGVKLPKEIPAGYQSVEFAQTAAGDAYDRALTGMTFAPDQQFAQEISGIVGNARNGGLSKPLLGQFRDVVDNTVLRRAGPQGQNLQGNTLKTVLSELNQKASKYNSSSVASEQEYGAALSSISDAIENAARRASPPENTALLDAADKAYAKLVRIEGAAKNAKGGVFSPAQLETSIRQSDGSVRKRAVAAGKGLMQDYASAGREIIPQSLGDSGTAGREAVWSPLAWGVDLAAYLPYKASQAVTNYSLAREPGVTAKTLAELLRLSAPVSAKTVPMIGYGLANERP